MIKLSTEDYMMSEMLEQPAVVRRILNNPQIKELADKILEEDIQQLILTGSGDSYCAAWYGSILGKEICSDIEIKYYAPFEFVNYSRFKPQKTAVLGISVSGGTLRVLEAIRYAKKHGVKTFGFTDNPLSKIAKESDRSVFLSTSPAEELQTSSYESDGAKNYIGYHHDVAQTKTYLGNIVALSLLMSYLASSSTSILKDLAKSLEIIPEVIEQKNKYVEIGKGLADQSDRVIFVSSGVNRPTSLFGAYKMFEFTLDGYFADIEEYCHTKYFITDNRTSVIFLAPDKASLTRVLEIEPVIRELIEAKTVILVNRQFYQNDLKNSFAIRLPMMQIFSPLVLTIPIEFISYSLAKKRGFNTNTFRGGQETEKYVSGSFKTIRQSKLHY